ncbi:hypothetical protein [Micromonospora sp. DT233]|uniref:hypothetical protein n=1 Tax=Micromonospora sp. DT233 TaxID=3393432 RepID=UPI003CF4B52D
MPLRASKLRYEPHEVVLTVEIVSPSTRSIDWVLKPALYAQAGIPFHWRVEIEDDGREPFPVNLSISRLTRSLL